jgi:hypothetical protein
VVPVVVDVVLDDVVLEELVEVLFSVVAEVVVSVVDEVVGIVELKSPAVVVVDEVSLPIGSLRLSVTQNSKGSW